MHMGGKTQLYKCSDSHQSSCYYRGKQSWGYYREAYENVSSVLSSILKSKPNIRKEINTKSENGMKLLYRFTVWLHLNSVGSSVPILPAQRSLWSKKPKMLQNLKQFWCEKWSTRSETFVWKKRKPGRAHDKHLNNLKYLEGSRWRKSVHCLLI